MSPSHREDTLASPCLARRGLIGTDIEQYSRFSARDQYEAQLAYDRALRSAASDAGLDIDLWHRQPAGDGEFAVLPDGVHEPRVLAVLLPRLAARLREYNRPRLPDMRIRLRVAVHHGLIHLGGPTGFPGRHSVALTRLLDAESVRALLRAEPDISLAAIIASDLYEDIVVGRYGGLRPEQFDRVRVNHPAKNFSCEAWVYAPELTLIGP
jgi:hypothetical protein